MNRIVTARLRWRGRVRIRWLPASRPLALASGASLLMAVTGLGPWLVSTTWWWWYSPHPWPYRIAITACALLALSVCVLVHETGHVLGVLCTSASRVEIFVSPALGITTTDAPLTLPAILAGPGANVLLAAGLRLLIDRGIFDWLPPLGVIMLTWTSLVSLLLGSSNALLPLWPLDGWSALELVAERLSNRRFGRHLHGGLAALGVIISVALVCVCLRSGSLVATASAAVFVALSLANAMTVLPVRRMPGSRRTPDRSTGHNAG